MVNWHTMFLLVMQFICFTIIGTLIVRKSNNKLSYLLYVIFASVCYTSLLQLIQYTSVAALLILTSFFIFINYIEENKKSKKYILLYIILFTIGIMIRMQSLLIIAPFFAIYFVYKLILFLRKKLNKENIIKIIKHYLVFLGITVIVYLSNYIIYNTDDVYKNYMEYNDIRATLQDISYAGYEENKEVFDEIGWSKNDHYLFYTFNFGDENVYSKENLEKIYDYKKQNNDIYNFDFDVEDILNSVIDQMKDILPYISLVFLGFFVVAIYTNKDKRWFILGILLTTILTNIIFIVVGRTMHRVVIPKALSIFIIVITVIFAGEAYKFNYNLEDYRNYKDVIEYTNSHKENVYLYTVPSLQYRYLVYSVYEMPPKNAFSNLRVMGGWDMFTKNYYDFKERYNLEGTFLDLVWQLLSKLY